MGHIMVVLEHENNSLRPASLAALQFGSQAKALHGGKLFALLLGNSPQKAASKAAGYAVDEVITLEHALLREPMAESYAPLVAQVARDRQATLVAATASSFGKDLMPRVAALMQAGFASDVSRMETSHQFRRTTYAGSVWQTIQVQTPIVVATIRQTDFSLIPPSGSSSAPITSIPVPAVDTLGSVVIETRVQKKERPELTEARIVVSGGRGLKTKENFRMVEQLCDSLGAAMGASRAACDAGLVSNELQVGQTGKVVAPDLYIAIAISGAIQHIAGMKASKVIVAINKDPEAPIFQIADYGWVAPWEEAVPALLEEIKNYKKQGTIS